MIIIKYMINVMHLNGPETNHAPTLPHPAQNQFLVPKMGTVALKGLSVVLYDPDQRKLAYTFG